MEGSTIGLLYEFMRRSKDVLTKGVEENVAHKSKYQDVLKLFDIRWKWFKRPIHLVAHLLHPLWREEATFINSELMDAWMSYTEKLYSTTDCDLLFRELHEYRNGTGSFSYTLAREEISMLKPVTWWENFGGRTPKLQALAVRILSQDCSSGAAERNWNAHALAHTKTRNRLKPAQLERLVYVRENLRLVRKFETVNTSPMQVNPNEIDVSKTPEFLPRSHDNDIDREIYEAYFEEAMSLRRRTRSMTRDMASSSRGASTSRIGRRRRRGGSDRSTRSRRVTRSITSAGLPEDNLDVIEEEEVGTDEELTDEELVWKSSSETESEDEDDEEEGGDGL